MLLNRDELYEKLETAILNLPKRTFLNYREPLNIRLYEKNSVARNTLVIPVMAVMRRKFKPNMKKLPFPFPVTVTAN